MACKIIGLIRLKDHQAFEEYRNRVGETVSLYGGRVCARASFDQFHWNELGCPPFDALVELEFADPGQAKRWADSPEYQALLGVRQKAMDLTLLSVLTS